ncbi:MAG: hypothetical protein K1X72_15040 [Pyrinomonadaceae bacterium]|nr:hypothetical protein [Pyrinomonadaceae bacterium]
MKKLTEFFKAKQGKLLQIALGGIMILFIAIMVTVYFVAKQANPIFLDEKGRPMQSESGSHHY